ncbi:hypothetical protein EXIGLDRAFT_725001 [Exidia glandulosa HHB12029]|uniref:Uncharacterized protein n=1 Tax=Exidia glandulosa HHB12029 TaxID=1314781 RepID=A0A165MNG5_EXIGL|nr:hypothetical protein EXIGLDRAFT_725001 [Exidia glandulosa HHB12029]
MPSSTTARLRGLAIALPLSAIVVIVVIFVTVWLRRRRRKAQRQAIPLIRPYGQSLSASSPVDSVSSTSVVHEGKQPLSSKEVLPIPDATKISVSVSMTASDAGNFGTPRNTHELIPTSTMAETGLADLSRAVEQAGFSLDALVTSLRLVHHSALHERDTEFPPMYDGR